MNRTPDVTTRRILRTTALAALLLGPAACLDYTIETTVNPDGSGVRVERMEVTRNDDAGITGDELRALTLATPERGWTSRVDEDGDTTWVFERTRTLRDLGAWSAATGDPLILGTIPAKAETRLGYVRLGDVQFRSSIQVGVSRRSDGTSLVSYREAFVWDHAADALVEFTLRDLDGILKSRYARLTDAERGSIVGYARARIWVAGDEGLFFGENEEEAIARAVESTAEHAVKVMRVRYPDADTDVVRQVMSDLLELDDDQTERLFLEALPGLNLGFNTSVVFRLTLPGRVTSSNADGRDGNVLEWKFSPLDDLMGPVEVFAESIIGG
jgi:hypothetical protein